MVELHHVAGGIFLVDLHPAPEENARLQLVLVGDEGRQLRPVAQGRDAGQLGLQRLQPGLFNGRCVHGRGVEVAYFLSIRAGRGAVVGRRVFQNAAQQ